jgi:hypothetical protein
MGVNLGAESPSSKRGSSRFRSQKPVHVAAARWWSALDLILNITCDFHRRLFPKIAFAREPWHLASGRYSETIEEEALRTGISLGITVIDAAEIYSGGHFEELVGRVMAGRRDQAFIVSSRDLAMALRVLASGVSAPTIDLCLSLDAAHPLRPDRCFSISDRSKLWPRRYRAAFEESGRQ